MSQNEYVQFTRKKNLIKDLLKKQVDLAKLTADSYNGGSVEMNIYLIFMIMMKNSNSFFCIRT